jgi:hypothetical protein
MRCTFLFPSLFVLVISIVPVFAQDSDADPARKLRTQFEREMAILGKPLDDLNSKYREYLETQKNAYQKDGNLKGMLAVEEELANFGTKTSSEGTLSSFQELKKLQKIYREQRLAHEMKAIESKLSLVRSFAEKAQELARELTKQGRIEKAKLALNESERLEEIKKTTSQELQLNRNRAEDSDESLTAVIEPTVIWNRGDPDSVWYRNRPNADSDINPGMIVIDRDGNCVLWLEFRHKDFGSVLHPIEKATLLLKVLSEGKAATKDSIDVRHKGVVIGQKKGGKLGESIRVPLDVASIQREEVLKLELRGGEDGVYFSKKGKNGPRLEIRFEN